MTALNTIRTQSARILTYAHWAYIPFLLIIELMIGQDSIWATMLVAVLVAAGPTIALYTIGEGAVHRYLVAAAQVLMAALLVAAFTGHPWQIDAHMYFFAAIAVVAIMCDWRAVLIAAGVTAIHHLLFNMIVPSWVFPDGADFTRVVLHAVIVVIESAALYWLTSKLQIAFEQAGQASQKAQDMAEAAQTQAIAAEQATAEAKEALAAMEESEREKQAVQAAAEVDVEEVGQQAVEERSIIADSLDRTLRTAVNELNEVNTTLEGEVRSLEGIARDTASAMSVATGATDNVAQNVNTVASSAEEMSASIMEISRQVSLSTQVVGEAREHAELSEQRINELVERADKINDVLKMIGEIAEQTNLLALNATIEAARAGEAGKGFAVVASEVKSLANQSGRATEEIGQLLAGIRAATSDAVDVNKKIVQVVGQIGENSNGIAAAVEEQSAATEEIARSAQAAAGDTTEASQAVRNLAAMSSKIGEVSSMTSNAVSALSGQTEALSSECDAVVARIRA
jgi:methyl-accepting chemotaxis protein